MASDPEKLSKTKVDQLGDRLRTGQVSDGDLRSLDAYRKSFVTPYSIVVDTIRANSGLEATGRPAKSTKSIVDKLRRETIRLSQVQDIAGCRLVVDNIAVQDRAIAKLTSAFGRDAAVVDRRVKPSFGYRAVHVIVHLQGKSIEVQVRTTLQHRWAEVTEKVSDRWDPGIKYGSSADELATLLIELSGKIAEMEDEERLLAEKDVDERPESTEERLPADYLQRKGKLIDDMESLFRAGPRSPKG